MKKGYIIGVTTFTGYFWSSTKMLPLLLLILSSAFVRGKLFDVNKFFRSGQLLRLVTDVKRQNIQNKMGLADQIN